MIFNFIKTLYLIARVSPPYRQKGNNNKSLLILGDSTGYGTGATRPSESLAGLIGAAFPDLKIVNKSVNGRTTAQLKQSLQHMRETHDFILLQIGANDVLQAVPNVTIVDTIKNIVGQLLASKGNVIVMTSGNIGAAVRFSPLLRQRYTEASREYEKLLLESAASTGLFKLVSQFSEPQVDPFVLQPDVYFASDGLHPTSAGYALWFDRLKPHLEKMVR